MHLKIRILSRSEVNKRKAFKVFVNIIVIEIWIEVIKLMKVYKGKIDLICEVF